MWNRTTLPAMTALRDRPRAVGGEEKRSDTINQFECGRHRGVPVHDIAPVRIAHRQALLDLQIADRAFGYPLEMLLRAAAAGWRIAEHPVAYGARAGGRSKVSGSVRGSLRAARDMAGLLR